MPGEIFVERYTPPQESVHAWFCSICDGSIHTLSHPRFDPKTATECPLCGNPNKPEEKTDV